MAHSNNILRVGTLALLLGTTSAQAEVTAAQVWQDWKDYSASIGQTMTAGAEAVEGDTLKLSNVTISSEVPDGSFTGSIDEVRFRDVGDGTVEITLSPEYPLVVKSKPAEGEALDLNLLVKMPDAKMVASGGTGEIAYAITAPSVGLAVTNMTVDGKPVDAKIDAGITNMTGTYISKAGETRTLATEIAADAMNVNVAVTDAEAGNNFSLIGTAEAVKGKSDSIIPGMINMADMGAALGAGFAGNGTVTTGKVNYDFKATDASGEVTGNFAAADSTLAFNMDKTKLSYAGGSHNIALSVAGAQIPFPINLTGTEMSFDLLMPVSKGDAPQDFRYVTKLVELSMNDELWAMVDPTAQLPHDPVSLVVDTNGTATLTADFFDPATTAPGAPAPGQIDSLNINALQLKAVGAELTGNGALTFDNADTTTYPGMPKPVGKVSLQLAGGNALLDKLVAMSLIPEDQAMSARMMLGLFAKPGAGEDTLVSDLEMGADGSVTANGQRIK